MSKRFRIAFSFAGEKRDFVAQVAGLLAKRFGEEHVLYDKYHQAEFARSDLAFHLTALYHAEADLAAFAEKLRKKHGYPIACFGHAGDGNIHVNIMAAHYHDDAAVRKKVGAALDELFAQVLAWGGVITGEHGIGLAKERWWPQATTPVSREVHTALKTALDPQGILNPGKFVAAAQP